jgi:hypothetical protein
MTDTTGDPVPDHPLHAPASGSRVPAATGPRSDVRSVLGRYLLPVLWGVLPFVAGPAFADALDPRSRPVQLVASTGLWLAWAVALGAALVPRTVSLTIVRIIMPASVVAAVWAALVAPAFGVAEVVALAAVAIVTITVLAPFTGDLMVNGSAYGDERRMPLRAPAGLMVGPLELAWVVCIVGVTAGPLLLASSAWVLGGVALVIGWPAAYVAARALHGLSERWIVFVPAGFVLHDQMTIADPMMIPRRMVASMGPAPADTSATDFTGGSFGLALQVELTDPVEVAPLPRRTRPGQRPSLESIEVTSFLCTPTRPGAVLREARGRRLPA